MRRAPSSAVAALAALAVVLTGLPPAGAMAQNVPGTAGFDPRQPPTETTVRRGETLFDIAERTRSPLAQLIAVNGLQPPYVLRPGQVLQIPPLKVHVVQRGESLNQIAQRYAIDPRSLRVFNQLPRDPVLQPGQRIILPAGVTDRMTGLEPQDLVDLLAAERAAGRPVSGRSRSAATSRAPATLPPVAPPTLPAAPPAAPPTAPPATAAPPATGAAPARPPAGTTRPAATTAAPSATPPGTAANRPLPPRVETPPPAEGGRFSWPLLGRVIETFGPKPGFRQIDGIEIEAAEGTPFGAAAAGTVVYVGNELPGYGWLVLVDHGGDWLTAYAFASRIVVREGQRVTRGQTLGTVGTGGRARSPRLHFQVRRGTEPVDPARQLPRNSAT